MDREDILQRLDRLDMEAFTTVDTPFMYRMIIVGGSGLVLLGVISRATQDIDSLEAPNEIRHLLAKYDANLRVAAYVNTSHTIMRIGLSLCQSVAERSSSFPVRWRTLSSPNYVPKGTKTDRICCRRKY